MFEMETAYSPAELMMDSAVMVVSSPAASVVVTSHPPRPPSIASTCVTGLWNAQMPPASVNDPSRNCIRACESTMPVDELSSTPASARTSGSRSCASRADRKRVGMPFVEANAWILVRASICAASCATIHFPVLRWGMEWCSQREYSNSLPRRQSFVLRDEGP
jgi:hypothetical protein